MKYTTDWIMFKDQKGFSKLVKWSGKRETDEIYLPAGPVKVKMWGPNEYPSPDIPSSKIRFCYAGHMSKNIAVYEEDECY